MEHVAIEKKNFKLITGEFSPENAEEILMDLINKKINFHHLRDFSHQERFGKSDEATLRRIKELDESKAEINQLIQKASTLGKLLRINSTIQMEITE